MYQRNPLRSVLWDIAGNMFLIGSAIAFWISRQFNDTLFMPILYRDLAGSPLLGTIGSLNPHQMFDACHHSVERV